MVKVWVSISGGGVRVVVYAASVYVTVVVWTVGIVKTREVGVPSAMNE